MRWVIGVFGLATVLAAPAQAAPAEMWDVFGRESIAAYGDPDAPAREWDDILWRAYTQTEDPEQAVALFGEAVDVRPDTAAIYADLIVRSVVIEACQQWGGRLRGYDDEVYDADLAFDNPEDAAAEAEAAAIEAAMAADAAARMAGAFDQAEEDYVGVDAMCLAQAPQAFLEEALAIADEEPSGELLFVILRNTEYRRPLDEAIGLALRHPQAQRVLLRYYEWNLAARLQLALVALDPNAPESLAAVAGGLDSDTALSGPAAGWAEAILEVARARAGDHEARLVYDYALMKRSLAVGLADEAVRLYLAQTPADRARMLREDFGCAPGDCPDAGAIEPYLSADLVAALWLVGERDEALALLDRAVAATSQPGGPRDPRLAALGEALRPTMTPDEVFTAFILGDPNEPQNEHEYSMEGTSGWLFAIQSPLPQRVLAPVFSDAGYDRLASGLARAVPYGFESDEDAAALLTEIARRLGPDVEQARAIWLDRLRAAAGTEPGFARRYGTPPLSTIWSESRLPPGMSAWAGTDENDFDAEPADPPFNLPEYVSPYGLIRAERIGGERVALFQSGEYDLPGEIPAYGLWLVRTENNLWREPVYLGLQTMFPYVPTQGSALPLVQDGRLQIEMRVRELDPDTITFPPIGLGYLREEDGVVLTAALSDLEHDADLDGLTDIAERRLGLDPASADSDGDGGPDGADPLPGVAYNPAASPARTALALAILERMVGHDQGAILVGPESDGDPLAMLAGPPQQGRWATVFMVGDPADYAALVTPFRLIVRTREEFDAANAGGPPFFPPAVTIYSSPDDRTHLVIWSASWVGGTFVVRCPAEGTECEVEELSSWIT